MAQEEHAVGGVTRVADEFGGTWSSGPLPVLERLNQLAQNKAATTNSGRI